MIPEITLNQIQDRVDIVEIISAFVPLRRSGKNFKGNCPFHQEKTPSFMVNPDKQIFHCFGCGAGGNVFSFLMKSEKKDFREVVEMLADRVGIEIPKDKIIPRAVAERTEGIVKAHRVALEFYHQFLLHRDEASKARAYLKKRALNTKTISEFQLGFAPESWEALTFILRKEVPESILEKSGLVLARKEGGFYDRFRNRIIFPILDAKGVCVAFGGRVLDDSLPKYLNSPETELYTKGRHLYGLYQARAAIREKDAAIVVEGYMDVIGCVQAGVQNVVASLGTALTPEQVRLVKRHTRNVFILYDADKAGEAATQRGLELFLEEDMEVRIVRLSEGHDPDSFIRDIGVEAFQKALDGAQTLFEYRLALLKKKYGMDTLESKVKIAGDMVRFFAKIRNEILLSAWTGQLAKELKLSEEALKAELRRSREGVEKVRRREPELVRSAVAGPRTVECILLGLFLECRDFLSEAKTSLSLEDFESPSMKKVMAHLFELNDLSETPSVAHLINFYKDDPSVAPLLTRATAETERVPDKGKAFDDCVLWMKRSRVHQDRMRLQSQIEEAQRNGDKNRIQQLLRDFSELNKGMKKGQ
jgi:DNA primase